MTYESFLFDKEDCFGILTINRPKALNALNSQVLKELLGFCQEMAHEPKLRCLILKGAGDKAFVAGADIKEMNGMSEEEALSFARLGQSAFNALEALPMPVIAAVNGFALGGGLELALASDLILASETASFGLPEVTLGLLPAFGGTQRLARAVGLYKARELIYSGERYSATACVQMGLVNKVVPQGDLLAEAKKLASLIGQRGPLAVSAAKKAMNEGFDQLLSDGLKGEAALFGKLFLTQDQKEGVRAFVEKRPPNFTGQ